MKLKDARCHGEATTLLTESFRLAPDQADVHLALAAMGVKMGNVNAAISDPAPLLATYETLIADLYKTRQYSQVIIGRMEICRLMPANPRAWIELGMAQMMHDEYPEAAANLARAICMNPADTEPLQSFMNCLSRITPLTFNPDVKEALQVCFRTPYAASFQAAYRTWQSIVFTAPETAALKIPVQAASESVFTSWVENLDHEKTAPLRDRFFCDGLRLMIVINADMENFLTRIRRWLCLHPDKIEDDGFLPFLCALAEQCFYNEFVFFLTEEESERVTALACATPENMTVSQMVLLGCYMPLYRTFPDGPGQPLRDSAESDPSLTAMIRTHFDNPAEEKRLEQEIPTFGTIAAGVSRAVQDQYEENPFPRWISTFSAAPRNTDAIFPREERSREMDVLVAGCGTGQHAINVAATYPNARITAIDLSRASLSYAQRKANEIGFGNRIKFTHADILSMQDWPRKFDMIEAAGVLHHMALPFQGWRILKDRLQPGGYFKVALYSELARRHIWAMRAAIRKYGFPSTPEGIRACRQMILDPAGDPEMQKFFL
ncbi:MAG TPA: class I SAM-dependent methyltransferase, partial [Micavibrio sp.]